MSSPANPASSIAGAIAAVVASEISQGRLRGEAASALSAEKVPLERPKNREHGDYASSIALALAKSEGKTPREIAELIKVGLEAQSGIAKVEIAGPGFINITLSKSSQGAIVARVLSEGEKFGEGKGITLSGVKINLNSLARIQPVHFILAIRAGQLSEMRWRAYLPRPVHK